jgi:hypothetical protein
LIGQQLFTALFKTQAYLETLPTLDKSGKGMSLKALHVVQKLRRKQKDQLAISKSLPESHLYLSQNTTWAGLTRVKRLAFVLFFFFFLLFMNLRPLQ